MSILTTIKEIRIVCQDWIKNSDSKTGWQSLGGWYFKDDNTPMPENWHIIYQAFDKFGNPIIGIAEKFTTIDFD